MRNRCAIRLRSLGFGPGHKGGCVAVFMLRMFERRGRVVLRSKAAEHMLNSFFVRTLLSRGIRNARVAVGISASFTSEGATGPASTSGAACDVVTANSSLPRYLASDSPGSANTGGPEGAGPGVDVSRSNLRPGRSQRDWPLPKERSRFGYGSRLDDCDASSCSESRLRYLEIDSPGRTCMDPALSTGRETKFCSGDWLAGGSCVSFCRPF